MKYLFFTIVFLLWLSGCSGGISGTGDGGPVLPIDGGEVTLDTGVNETLTGGTNTLEERFAAFPSQLLLDLPNSLQADSSATQANTNALTTPSSQLREGVSASLLTTIEIQLDLQLLQNHINTNASSSLSNNDWICIENKNCAFTNQQFRILFDSDAAMFAAELLSPYAVTSTTAKTAINAGVGEAISYSNVSLQTNLPGFYDNRLQYSRANNSQITLHWSSDQLVVSVLALDTDSTLHSLMQADQNEMTLRRTDHSRGDTSLQLVVNQDTVTDATYLEADQSSNEPFFIRSISNSNNGVFFSVSLLPKRTQYREATDSKGRLTDAETCTDPCSQWQSLLDSQTLPTGFYDTSHDTIDSASGSLENPLNVTALPDDVSEFVITTGDDTGTATNPTTQPATLACGGQRVANSVRTFCWQPTPLETPTTFIFEENRVDNAVTYRLITQSNNL